MPRLTRTQLLIGDCKTARELGISDGEQGKAIEPGQVPKNARMAYLQGHARGTARASRLAAAAS